METLVLFTNKIIFVPVTSRGYLDLYRKDPNRSWSFCNTISAERLFLKTIALQR